MKNWPMKGHLATLPHIAMKIFFYPLKHRFSTTLGSAFEGEEKALMEEMVL